MKRTSRRLLSGLRVASAAFAILTVVAGCTSSSHKTATTGKTGTPQTGGDVKFAMPPASTPNWLFPIATPGHLAQYNFTIQSELYVPLYSFNGSSGTIALDDKASAANAPTYAGDGKSVTVPLKS